MAEAISSYLSACSDSRAFWTSCSRSTMFKSRLIRVIWVYFSEYAVGRARAPLAAAAALSLSLSLSLSHTLSLTLLRVPMQHAPPPPHAFTGLRHQLWGGDVRIMRGLARHWLDRKLLQNLKDIDELCVYRLLLVPE